MDETYFNFEILPNDLRKDYIINFLGINELVNLSKTSSEYVNLLENNEMWINLITRDFNIKINRNIFNLFRILKTIGNLSCFNIYQFLYKISKFNEQSMDIIKQIYNRTKEKTILLMLNRLTMLSSIKNLLSLRKQCNIITKENIENNQPEDIRLLALKIKELAKERIFMKTMSEIQIDGSKILKQLYNRKNRNYYGINIDLYKKLNSQTTESYWFLIFLLEKYYYDEKFCILLKSLLNTETKKFLSNFYRDIIFHILYLIPDIKTKYNVNKSPILRKYINQHTLSLWLISYVIFNKSEDFHKNLDINSDVNSDIIYNKTVIFLQNSCRSEEH